MPYMRHSRLSNGTQRGLETSVTYTNALVADAQDRLRVCDDEELDIASAGHFKEVLFHAILFWEREIETFAPAEEMRVVCYRISLINVFA